MLSRRLFVTTRAALSANAPFHIGHMMEYIQADIWVRVQRMQGHEVHFMGADDAARRAHYAGCGKRGEIPRVFVAEIARGRGAVPRGLSHRLRQLHLHPFRETPSFRRTSTAG